MKVLVAGSSGFLGSEVVRLFRADGHHVHEMTRTRSKDEISAGFALGKFPEIQEFRPEIVINCAGIAHRRSDVSYDEFYTGNVEFPRSLAKFSVDAGCRHFIHVSSVSVYGTNSSGRAFVESDPCSPVGDYARSKFEGELALSEELEGKDLCLSILRPATILGEGDPGNIARLIRMIRDRRFIFLGKGQNEKSLIWKSDVALTMLELAREDQNGRIVLNITNDSIKVADLVETICSEMGRDRPLRIPFPNTLAGLLRKTGTGFGKAIGTWFSDERFSNEKLKEVRSPEVNPAEAIKREVRWILNEG